VPDVAIVLKEEISRIARKEIRARVDPLKKQVIDLRRRLRAAEATLLQLQKTTNKTANTVSRQSGAIVPDVEETRQIRISPNSVKKLRTRLRLTQAQMAQLVDVSTNTVVRWEQGTSSPRGGSRAVIASMRSMGIKQVKKQLEKMA
jgi:DNA-binding transcriptional regulator YiaG